MKYLFLILVFANTVVALGVSNIEVPSDIHLNSGTSTKVQCNASIFHPVSYMNISTVNATLYSPDISDYQVVDDPGVHYTNSSCITFAAGNFMNVTCSFSIDYFSYPGIWYCNFSASDADQTVINGTSTFVNELLAFSISSISYVGVDDSLLGLGNLSEQSVMNISNLGNINLSLEVSGTNMSCTSGSIAASNQVYSIFEGFSYSQGTSLAESPNMLQNFSVPRRTDAPVIYHLYWLLQMPMSGVGGSCSGGLTINVLQ